MTNPFQTLSVDRDRIIITRGARPPEFHQFATPAEAKARAAIIGEAFSWIGTPFQNCGDTKGRAGGVDCAMLAVRCFVDTGALSPFDPRPYPPNWMMHHSEERFLGWIQDQLGAHEVDQPRPGDVLVWQFGRCFSHCGIAVNGFEVIHAFKHAGMTMLCRMDEHRLQFIKGAFRRPVKFFSIWKA
jgi:cell wall-associated NlpC family hydrolase